MVKVVVVLTGTEGVSGTENITQEGEGPMIVTKTISSLVLGLHGFHVHALGDTTNGCMSTGPHFNPAGKDHGALEDENYHVGDLGNVTPGDDGTVTFTKTDKQIPLLRLNSIIGRVVVVHTDSDDLGKVCMSSARPIWWQIGLWHHRASKLMSCCCKQRLESHTIWMMMHWELAFYMLIFGLN